MTSLYCHKPSWHIDSIEAVLFVNFTLKLNARGALGAIKVGTAIAIRYSCQR